MYSDRNSIHMYILLQTWLLEPMRVRLWLFLGMYCSYLYVRMFSLYYHIHKAIFFILKTICTYSMSHKIFCCSLCTSSSPPFLCSLFLHFFLLFPPSSNFPLPYSPFSVPLHRSPLSFTPLPPSLPPSFPSSLPPFTFPLPLPCRSIPVADVYVELVATSRLNLEGSEVCTYVGDITNYPW